MQMKQQLHMMKSLSNPKGMVEYMLKNNPNAAEINKLIQNNGGDLEKAFRAKAKEMNVDPEQIISALKS